MKLLILHAIKRLRDKEEARDAVNDVFSQLWIKRDNLEPALGISNYLYAAIRNKVLNLLSNRDLNSKYILSLPNFYNEAECLTDHLARERQLAAIIENEVKELPSKMRIVFEMSRKEGLSHKEIAERLFIFDKTVKSHINRAIRILRDNLTVLVVLSYLSESEYSNIDSNLQLFENSEVKENTENFGSAVVIGDKSFVRPDKKLSNEFKATA